MPKEADTMRAGKLIAAAGLIGRVMLGWAVPIPTLLTRGGSAHQREVTSPR